MVKDEYFGIKWNKLLRLWGQIVFYSICLFGFSYLIGFEMGGIKTILRTFLPLTFEQWWFASTYFVMFLLHPFLNKLLWSFDKKQYQYYLTVLIILWVVIPTITSSNFQSNALIEFMVYYSIAGYIRLYGFSRTYSCKKWFGLWLLFTIVTYISCVIFMIIGTKYSIFSKHATFFYGRDSILTVFRAICFFMAFNTMDMKNNRFVNKVATTTFGVYLLHDSDVVRVLLWKVLFKNATYLSTVLIIPISIFAIIAVFIVCSLVDILRQKTIEKIYMAFWDKHLPIILNWFNKIKETINGLIF